MIVVAVGNLDVDACLGHPARDFSQLTGLPLIQTLDEHVAHCQYPDASRFERPASSLAIFKEKMRCSLTIDNPRAAALNAHSGAAEGIPHVGEGAGAVIE